MVCSFFVAVGSVGNQRGTDGGNHTEVKRVLDSPFLDAVSVAGTVVGNEYGVLIGLDGFSAVIDDFTVDVFRFGYDVEILEACPMERDHLFAGAESVFQVLAVVYHACPDAEKVDIHAKFRVPADRGFQIGVIGRGDLRVIHCQCRIAVYVLERDSVGVSRVGVEVVHGRHLVLDTPAASDAEVLQTALFPFLVVEYQSSVETGIDHHVVIRGVRADVRQADPGGEFERLLFAQGNGQLVLREERILVDGGNVFK